MHWVPMRWVPYLLLLAFACGDGPTGIRLRIVPRDVSIPIDVASIEVVARGLETEELLMTERLELLADEAKGNTFLLRPGSSRREDVRITVRAFSLDAGAPVQLVRELRYGFTPGRVLDLVVFLDAACIGDPCDPSNDCLDGRCGPPEDPRVSRRRSRCWASRCWASRCWPSRCWDFPMLAHPMRGPPDAGPPRGGPRR